MNKTLLQVQPQFSVGERWMALSRREGLFFEPLELEVSPANRNEAVFKQLSDWYAKSGRVTSLHGAFIDINPASGDPGFYDLSRTRCRASCKLARRLGAERVVFHASAHPFLRGAYLDNWAATCADFYDELSYTYGLEVCVENSQDLDSVPLRELMKRSKSRKVCVCLDIGHVNYSLEPVEKWFDQLGEHIGYMHLSDNMGSFDDHLPIGAGVIEWDKIHRLWESLDRYVPMTLEVGGLSGVTESLDFIRKNGYFGIKEHKDHE